LSYSYLYEIGIEPTLAKPSSLKEDPGPFGISYSMQNVSPFRVRHI